MCTQHQYIIFKLSIIFFANKFIVLTKKDKTKKRQNILNDSQQL